MLHNGGPRRLFDIFILASRAFEDKMRQLTVDSLFFQGAPVLYEKVHLIPGPHAMLKKSACSSELWGVFEKDDLVRAAAKDSALGVTPPTTQVKDPWCGGAGVVHDARNGALQCL